MHCYRKRLMGKQHRPYWFPKITTPLLT